MNVSLTAELEHYVKAKVATGMYHSVSEVMREALRLMEERDALYTVRLDALRQDINKSLDSIKQNGSKPLDIEAIKAKGRAHLQGKAN